MSVHWHAHPTPEQAAEACAQHILVLLEEALSGESCATLALSGGATPKPLFEKLAAAKFGWEQVHLFWVDERSAPPTDARSNYWLAERCLIVPARIPRRNVHRIMGEFRPDHAAQRYVDEIREFFGLAEGEVPHFDVIERGVGADGHTASLFPGNPLLEDRERIAAAVYVDQVDQWRITLLPAALLAARHTVFFVTGGEKAEAVRAVFHEPYNPTQLPAQMVSYHGRKVNWFLDDAAASRME